jgi:hypothetical protein
MTRWRLSATRRLLVATAIEIGCKPVTYDRRLSDYAVGVAQQTGLQVVG